MKNKKTAILIAIALSVAIFTACSKDSNKAMDSSSKTEESQQVENSTDKTESEHKTDSTGKADSTDKKDSTDLTSSKDISNNVTKIKGRKKEFLDRLDNIQKELDALPEKKDSDNGITNAMRSYYGKSYEAYDKELNEIYALLKEQLSKDVMEKLKAEEIAWIKEKEDAANKEAAQYKGGTFEYVAYYISLYESTKERCYELVQTYMTD